MLPNNCRNLQVNNKLVTRCYAKQYEIVLRCMSPCSVCTADFFQLKMLRIASQWKYWFFSSDSSGTISPPAPPPSILVIYLPWIKQPQLFERIRGFRFSMAAGSQSVESWAKKLDLVQLRKKIHFSFEIARCSTRARLPKGHKNF